MEETKKEFTDQSAACSNPDKAEDRSYVLFSILPCPLSTVS